MKVFISSTYKDLIDYRAAAIRAVEGTNYQASKMEVFGARPDEPLDACLKEVEKSDFFLGIYAHRYGYIPAGSDISITEMEYVHARKLGKTIYCFVIDEENQPWLPKFIEGEPGAKKLKDFKRRIQTDHVCAFFTSPEDLGMKVANALSHYAANHHEPDFQVPIYQSPKPTGNTLPHQEFFFGREKELESIRASLSPETRAWGALIDGPGGIGKTALAIKAAHDASAELFDRKIFITAKVRDLTPEGEKPLTDFTRPTYLAMLDELGKELGEDGLEKLPPDNRPDTLRLALVGRKALIIFDNLETLPEQERTRLFQFLSRLPEGNKAIVTSRRRDDVDARIIRLDRLSHNEAMQLVEELAKKYPRLQRATKEDHEKLYAITQGNPLFIRWIAGQLGRVGSKLRTVDEAVEFIDKAPKDNDPLEYIFGDLLETFTTDEMKVLAALTHFTQSAKLNWLSQMTDLPERSTETALEDLADRSILIADIESKTFYLPPLAAQFIKTRRPDAVTQTGDALTNHAYALALEYGGHDNYEGFHRLDAEWDFISAALPRLLTGDYANLESVYIQLYQFLNFTGRWDNLLWLSEQAEERAIAVNNKENAGGFAYYSGMMYFFRNQPAEVLACAARAIEYFQDSTPRNKAGAILLRGNGHVLEEDYPAAIAAHNEAVDILRSISPESMDVGTALNSLANAEKANGNYDAAERNYRESLRIDKINNDDEGIAIRTGNLAALALDREQWAEAESLAREALALDEKVGRQELSANNCHNLAKALLKQNKNLDEALTFARRAVEIYTHLSYPSSQLAQKTVEEIEKAIQQ